MIERELRDFMLADSAIGPLVGSGRVYPVELPEQPKYPAIAYQKISGNREHTLDAIPYGAEPRYQITAFALTWVEAKTLSAAIEAAFDGHLGPLVSGSPIQATFVLDVHDHFDPTARVAMVPVDVVVIYNPAGPPTPTEGAVPGWQKYIFGFGLVGAVDGVNQIYTVPVDPNPKTLVVVFNGMVVTRDRYAVVGNQIILSFAPKGADADYPADTLEVYC